VGLSKPTIFVVDDESDVRASLADIIGAAGYTVSMAQDGQEAIDRLLALPRPHLMVLDLKMPRKSGYDVLNALRNSTTLIDLPVVILSAYLEQPPAGAVAWLKKPVKPSLLLSTIDNYVDRQR
jgi:two-component system chemotaxis response regulator CheY